MFNWFSRPAATNMDAALAQAQRIPGARILDVRTPEEVAQGIVPGALWLPLDQITQLPTLLADKNTPLFIYCRSGARAGRAITELAAMGYTELHNAGGVLTYHGKLVPPTSDSAQKS